MKQQEFIELIKKVARISINSEKEIHNMQLKEELGIDSILLVSVIVELEKKMGEEISFEKLQRIDVKTPLDLWTVLSSNADE